jgi:hypothetical protein
MVKRSIKAAIGIALKIVIKQTAYGSAKLLNENKNKSINIIS